MSNYQKVKIIVAGDSVINSLGVGKTALVNLLCYDTVVTNPNWTIGAQVEIKLHNYQAGTPSQANYCVELWDIGGYKNHTNSRSVFYSGTDGIILVYDVTNKKSENNLNEWLAEILRRNPDMNQEGCSEETSIMGSYLGDSFYSFSNNFDWYRRSNNLTQMPILVIGTNLDQIPPSINHQIIEQRRGNFSQVNQYDEIILSNMSLDSLAPGCSNSVVIDRFFDQVISMKIFNKTNLDIIRSSVNIDSRYSNKRHVLIRIDKGT